MYIQNKTRKFKLSRKSALFLISTIIVFTVLVVGLIMLFTKGKEVKDTLTQMPFTNENSYFTVGNTIVYAQEELLTCVDSSLNSIWKFKVFSDGLDFVSNEGLIAATGQGVVQVFDANGNNLFSTQLDGIINSARVCKDKVAIYVEQPLSDETLSYIVIFDLDGISLYQIDISNRCVLDYGFDSLSNLLYILELDVSGASPISRISTYRPESESMTGIKEIKDQLIDSVYLIEDSIYASGTNTLTMYDTINSDKHETLVYGWILKDMAHIKTPSFLYVPNSKNPGFIDIARIIKTNGNETTINLPPQVFSIFQIGEKIYCFATSHIFVYTNEGKYLRTHELPFAIEKVQKATEGYVFVTSSGAVYLMPLP